MYKVLSSFFILASISSGSVFADNSDKRYFAEIGTSFGGAEVATNNNGGLGGDDYKAGGGAILGLGTKVNINKKFQAQAMVGIRYQAGDGSNSGIVLEGAALYPVSNVASVGLGLHADLNSKTETANGNTIDFENAVGPMLLLDWKIDSKLGLGAKYILMDYETSNSEDFDGDQFAVYVKFKF